MKKQRKPPAALILISAGFEEESTITCMKELRSSGAEAKLVGLTSGLLVGARGLTVRPDVTVAGLESRKGYRLVLVPGCTQSTRTLLADPRVHQLFAATAGEGGRVAVMSPAETAFAQAGFLDSLTEAAVMFQGEQDTAEFIKQLVHLTAE